MTPSEMYRKIVKYRHHLYNIVHMDNMPSIIENGILCKNRADALKHKSIANSQVQDRRDTVIVPNGLPLHSYANLYFDYWNPMLSAKRDINERICILGVDVAVLDLENVVITDCNAACDIVRFYDPIEIGQLAFEHIFAKYWAVADADEFTQRRRKAQKCAEVLVPERIDFSYVKVACVYGDSARDTLRTFGFSRNIIVDPTKFF